MIRLSAICLLLLAAQLSFAADPPADKPDLAPPQLRPVRWQYLDERFQDVYVDGSGRAWFLIRTHSAYSPPRDTFLVCEQAPKCVIETPGNTWLLGFDRHDRFWEISAFGLLCTDTRSGKFSQRNAAPTEDADQQRINRKAGKPFVMFAPLMLEHSGGERSYFIDSLGVHALAGQQWSYWKFNPPSRQPAYAVVGMVGTAQARLDYPDRFHDRYLMIELPDGRVAVQDKRERQWFVHDGKGWSSQGQPPVPATRPDAPGPIAVAADRPRVGRSTDPNCAAAALGGELAGWGAVCGQDGDGRVYLRCPDQVSYSGFDRIAVFDPQQPDNEPTVPYDCHKTFHIFGCPPMAAMDSAGQVWALLDRREGAFLSRFENGQWHHYDAPKPPDASAAQQPGFGETWFIIPLKRQCMLAGGWGLQRTYFFDGRQWHGGGDLKDLIAGHYQQLRGLIDNRTVCQAFHPGIVYVGVDATGRIHYRYGRDCEAYDGKQWGKSPPQFICLNADGTQCLTSNAIYDTSASPAKALAAAPSDVESPYGGHFFDSRGRAWQHGDVSHVPARFQDGRWTAIQVQQEYGPRLEDSAGRFWLHGTPSTWRVLGPDAVKNPRAWTHTAQVRGPLAEGRNGLFWLAASDGLVSLRVQGKGDDLRIVPEHHYTRLVPPGQATWLAMDGQGCLWLATYGGQSHLYRIHVPGSDAPPAVGKE